MTQSIAMHCAWCGATMRDGPLVRDRASHGICAPCLDKFRRESERVLPEPAKAR